MRPSANDSEAMTPSTADMIGDSRSWMEDSESMTTPGGELDTELKGLMRMESRPLTEDMETPLTLEPSLVEQHPLHPLHPARLYSKLARRALVSSAQNIISMIEARC